MRSFAAYPAYKHSGIDPIGEVPEHWKTIPIKFSLAMPITDGPHSTPTFLPEGVPFLSAESVKNDQLDFGKMRGFISEEDHRSFSRKYKPKFGDVYMVKSGATTGAVARVQTTEEFNIWSPLAVLRPHPEKALTDFIFLTLKSKPFFYSVELSWSYGTQQNIGMGVISDIRMPLPPLDEQEAIARFLDFKTAQIDALIAKEKTLLEKLAEKRTALISHAVTKGLDTSVPMKDSGVEWLGEIPMHWSVSRLSYSSKSMQTGPFGSQLHADEYVEGGVPLINPVDIMNGQIFDNPKITVGDDVVERLARHKLELGDIVIARRGEMGRAGLVRENNVGWLCGTGSLRARLRQDTINPEFLLYQFSMKGVVDYLTLQSVGSTMDNLNTTILGELPVILPPVDEQISVVSYLRKICNALDAQSQKVSQAISLLQEYRAALITSAVTGKIDVRDFRFPVNAANMAT